MKPCPLYTKCARFSNVYFQCHETRSLDKNRVLARQRMQERLDWFHNKENSVKELEKQEASARRKKKKQRTNRRLEKLREFKEREGLD